MDDLHDILDLYPSLIHDVKLYALSHARLAHGLGVADGAPLVQFAQAHYQCLHVFDECDVPAHYQRLLSNACLPFYEEAFFTAFDDLSSSAVEAPEGDIAF